MQALRLVSLRISGQEALCRLKLKEKERKYRDAKICGAGPAKKNKKTGTKHVPVLAVFGVVLLFHLSWPLKP